MGGVGVTAQRPASGRSGPVRLRPLGDEVVELRARRLDVDLEAHPSRVLEALARLAEDAIEDLAGLSGLE